MADPVKVVAIAAPKREAFAMTWGKVGSRDLGAEPQRHELGDNIAPVAARTSEWQPEPCTDVIRPMRMRSAEPWHRPSR